MKQSSILITVFAMLAANTMTVNAEVAPVVDAVFMESAMLRGVNFDGDSLLGVEMEAGAAPQAGAPVFAQPQDMSASVRDEKGRSEEESIDWYLKVAIAYAEQGDKRLKSNLIRLLLQGTFNEKYAFVHNDNGTYIFPGRFNNRYPGQQICVASHQEQECVNQLVCKMVCAAGGAAVGGVAGAVGATVCNEVCNNVAKCSNVTICDEYVTEPMNHGQDSHGNWR